MDSFGVSGLDSLVFVLISNTQRGRLHLQLEHLPRRCVFLYPGRVTDLEVGQNSTISKLFLPMKMGGVSQFPLASSGIFGMYAYTTDVCL